MRTIKLLLVVLCSIAVAACGGGGSGGSNTSSTAASPVTYSISGTVTGVAGATITLSGATTATTTTATDGSYSFAGLANGNYTVEPSRTGNAFTPISSAVTINGANVTGKDFTSAAYAGATSTLAGTVTGAWKEGVLVTLSGAGSGTAYTDTSGHYRIANIPAGTYTVTPSLPGYTYSPAASAVAISADATQDFTAASAISSYSISGTVSKTTSQNGAIYLQVYDNSCSGACGAVAGTRIATTGAYTIRGLQPGSYVVKAEMEMPGTKIPNATNPAGSSATATIAATSLSGVNVVVADSTPPAAVAPTGLQVSPSDSMAMITWQQNKDANGAETASAYKIYWGTDAAATNGTPITVNAKEGGGYFQGGLSNGSSYYYRISALVGATESARSAVVGPVTVGIPGGANTVSGTVTFQGTSAGPMLVGLMSFNSSNGTVNYYFTRISSPVSPQGYSISGVPDGSYYSFAIIDTNNNGFNSEDTRSWLDAQIAVAGNFTGNDLTVPAANATSRVTTSHLLLADGTHMYGVSQSISDNAKTAVAVALVSGPNVAVPLDVGRDNNGEFNWSQRLPASPSAGDAYLLKVTFSDGTTQNISGSVTTVLNPPQNPAVQTTAPGSQTVPLFTWAAPASPAASYTYSVSVYGSDAYWYSQPLPSTTSSALYDADGTASSPALTTGNTYSWSITVFDAHYNYATSYRSYTP